MIDGTTGVLKTVCEIVYVCVTDNEGLSNVLLTHIEVEQTHAEDKECVGLWLILFAQKVYCKSLIFTGRET